MSILNFKFRDHGIPGYNHYRAICNLTKVLAQLDIAVFPNLLNPGKWF